MSDDKARGIVLYKGDVKVFLWDNDKDMLWPIISFGGQLYQTESITAFDLPQETRDQILCNLLGLAPTGCSREKA